MGLASCAAYEMVGGGQKGFRVKEAEATGLEGGLLRCCSSGGYHRRQVPSGSAAASNWAKWCAAARAARPPLAEELPKDSLQC